MRTSGQGWPCMSGSWSPWPPTRGRPRTSIWPCCGPRPMAQKSRAPLHDTWEHTPGNQPFGRHFMVLFLNRFLLYPYYILFLLYPEVWKYIAVPQSGSSLWAYIYLLIYILVKCRSVRHIVKGIAVWCNLAMRIMWIQMYTAVNM